MADLRLTLGCWDYDRTRALLDGRVGVPGCSIDATPIPPEELFPRVVGEAPFDISEMSFSSYLVQVARGEGVYAAIPVFVSRAFRHGGIYVREGAGINGPKDLEGRLVGVPEYQMTMALWVRGILQDEYGVDFRKIKYRTGGANTPGRRERLPLDLPAGMDVEPVPEGRSLNDMLVSGELDAVFAPSPIDAFTSGDQAIRRLFADPVAEERAYYAKTGMFPIMHVIGVRRSLVDGHPGLAANLFRAFAGARNLAVRDLEKSAQASANRLSLPWPYGVAENRKELDAAVRYSQEQFLCARRLSMEELFVPETLDLPDDSRVP